MTLFDIQSWKITSSKVSGIHSDDFEELLQTALFKELEPNKFSWAHYSYTEYLAARYVQDQELTGSQNRVCKSGTDF
ncbi:hypothetical protein D1872_50300 [compost metagenome]